MSGADFRHQHPDALRRAMVALEQMIVAFDRHRLAVHGQPGSQLAAMYGQLHVLRRQAERALQQKGAPVIRAQIARAVGAAAARRILSARGYAHAATEQALRRAATGAVLARDDDDAEAA
jgi:hypothetical protein